MGLHLSRFNCYKHNPIQQGLDKSLKQIVYPSPRTKHEKRRKSSSFREFIKDFHQYVKTMDSHSLSTLFDSHDSNVFVRFFMFSFGSNLKKICFDIQENNLGIILLSRPHENILNLHMGTRDEKKLKIWFMPMILNFPLYWGPVDLEWCSRRGGKPLESSMP